MRHFISFILGMILSFGQSYGQAIENVDFNVRDNIIYIEYYLSKSNISYKNKYKYPIHIYVHNNGKRTEILRGVSGDILERPSRRKKTIKYNVLEDRSSLIGDIQFELQTGEGKPTYNIFEKSVMNGSFAWIYIASIVILAYSLQ